MNQHLAHKLLWQTEGLKLTIV